MNGNFGEFTIDYVNPVRVAPGTYIVPLSGDPIYFEGGEMVD